MAEQLRTALKILRRKQVLARLNIANATFYDWLNPASPRHDSALPKQIRLGPNTVGWLEHEIDAYIEHRAAVSRAPTA
ncbi:AlpA family phage regulatory protein [Ralstonia pseudosolanacearum]|uniref:helix-turn-helix transcriptional regulator n=1 Tax=Ralstonia pseudosolanacearum TaxID=1310165 RepID=UPI0009E1A5B7|nr:AlpA family phage regulatory protein [Ralstonia pseudosolanacearum]MCK4125254.1 AlpA family phage regulatory protein [Ralstonia pseudosolanacearum]